MQPGDRRHVVLLLHGIRTQGEWAQRAAAAIESNPSMSARPIRYEFFDALRFLFPFSTFREKPIRRITRLIRDELSRDPASLSVVAHSFGTYLIAKVLEREPDILLHRLILCGSIIVDDFEWEKYGHRLDDASEGGWQVVNDCGMDDRWPVIARSITWGYGASGSFGFGHPRVKDRYFNVGHSGFFREDFVRTYWLPYLSTGKIETGVLDRPTNRWWVSLLTVPYLKLRYLFLMMFLGLATIIGSFLVETFTESGMARPVSVAGGSKTVIQQSPPFTPFQPVVPEPKPTAPLSGDSIEKMPPQPPSLFTKHVEPAFLAFKKLHTDYLSSFKGYRQSLRTILVSTDPPGTDLRSVIDTIQSERLFNQDKGTDVLQTLTADEPEFKEFFGQIRAYLGDVRVVSAPLDGYTGGRFANRQLWRRTLLDELKQIDAGNWTIILDRQSSQPALDGRKLELALIKERQGAGIAEGDRLKMDKTAAFFAIRALDEVVKDMQDAYTLVVEEYTRLSQSLNR
jgi:pimeloyl-ACP methyl ester carboxylesterase